jgi:hypothetical protein
MEVDVKIQLRLRKKRREPPVKVRTFKDLHTRDSRQGSTADLISPVATVSPSPGNGAEAAASKTGHDIVMNHVLV